MDLPDKDVGCHRTGFARKCRELVVSGECNRWMQIQGSNPNTGEPVNRSKCSDDWLPLLLIENSQMQRQTGAAVESFRNEMLKANQASLAALVNASAKVRLSPAQEGNGHAIDHHPKR